MSIEWIVGQRCLMKRSHKKEGYLWTSIAQQFCRMPPNCSPFTGRHSKWAEDPLSFPRVDDLSFPSSILWSLVQRAQLRANYRPEHVRDSGSLNETDYLTDVPRNGTKTKSSIHKSQQTHTQLIVLNVLDLHQPHREDSGNAIKASVHMECSRLLPGFHVICSWQSVDHPKWP